MEAAASIYLLLGRTFPAGTVSRRFCHRLRVGVGGGGGGGGRSTEGFKVSAVLSEGISRMEVS